MLNIAIYVRVSTTEQLNGYSIDTQLVACRLKAKGYGLSTIVEFMDDSSGEYLERPSMEKLRAAIKRKEFTYIICLDPDRLARNLAHQLIIHQEIDTAGAELLFVSEEFKNTPEGLLYFSMKGAFSQYELAKIKERTMRGKRGKLTAGKLIFNAAPFGYDWDSDNCNYIINEEQAEYVRLIFDLLIKEKMGAARIATRLNEMNVPTKRGVALWSPGTIYQIITSEKYAGIHQGMKYYHKKIGINEEVRIKRDESEWIPVPVPAIISQEGWQAARVQIAANKSVSLRNTKTIFLLQNLLLCPRCNRMMGITYSGKSRTKYYRCRKDPFSKTLCDARPVRQDLLDNMIWEYVIKTVPNKKALTDHLKIKKDPSPDLSIDLEKSAKLEKKLLKQRETVMRWFSNQMIDDIEVEKQLDEIKKKLKRIHEERNRSVVADKPRRTVDEIRAIYNSFKIKDATPEMKQAILRELINKVYTLRTDTHRFKNEIDLKIEFK